MATLRRSGKLAALLGLLALVALTTFGAAGAAAEDGEPPAKPPQYHGTLSFSNIKSSSGPEQYFWEVRLHPGQELVQADARRAEVLFEDGVRASVIGAEQARDATGAEVPTSLEVIAPNYVSLTVHHRAGNPAAEGAPFHYPVTAGPPFTVGYSTVTFVVPPAGEAAPPPPPQCVVPKLTGRTLAASRSRLSDTGCQLGAIRGKRGKGIKVVKQFKPAGSEHAAGARVAVKLG